MAGPASIVKRFRELYPSSGEPTVWRAPGRVNLIGEHTDYNLGLVLPMAIDLECIIAAAPSDDGWLRVYSEQLNGGAQWPAADAVNLVPRGGWGDRVAGIAWELARRGLPVKGQNLLISSNVPLGAGLSSSAALGVSLALALGGPRPVLELAQLARAAEMDFVGVPCGLMDQFVSAHGGAVLLDCKSLTWDPVVLPRGVAIVAVNSMVKHDLAGSAYRVRVEECAAAARALGIASLREASVLSLEGLEGVLLKRARHVVTENARVEAFAHASAVEDVDQMGRLLVESHRSLRDDYQVSCEELDFLVDAAMGIPGVLGARMTGGGFGGSTVNLVRAESLAAFQETLSARYQRFYERSPEMHVCVTSAGASAVG